VNAAATAVAGQYAAAAAVSSGVLITVPTAALADIKKLGFTSARITAGTGGGHHDELVCHRQRWRHLGGRTGANIAVPGYVLIGSRVARGRDWRGLRSLWNSSPVLTSQ
jgi:hypothetical protein